MKNLPKNIKPEHIVQAIHKIEKEGIPAQAHSSTYDVLYEGKRFPPKLVVSYANIFANGVALDRSKFEGGIGTPCFKILEENGFTIVTKESMTGSEEPIKELLGCFIKQAHTSDQKTKHYLKAFDGLKVDISFGQGNNAHVPWISFLANGNTTSDGIYPVFLFYKKYDTLILAYGISEKNKPHIEWNIANGEKETVEDYFKTKGIVMKKYKDSYVYNVYDTSKELDFKSIESHLRSLIQEYRMTLDNAQNSELIDSKELKLKAIDIRPIDTKSKVKQQPFDLSSFVKDLESTGLVFSKQLVTRFVLSLLTKPFVILSGLSGSGKTKLAICFAKWICENDDEQLRVVPIGADWTNREFLLGYPNAIKPGKYVMPDNGALELLFKANKNKDKPYFLILDEMNLSYVERYLADFLSAMESGEKIPLMKDSEDVPACIGLPKNLFIIGTINVDETTYMFSPKVLDRANVIEFRIMPSDLDNFFQKSTIKDKKSIMGKGASQAVDFTTIANSDIDHQNIESRQAIIDTLKKFFLELKSMHAEFGYRTANELFRFISLGQKLKTGWTLDEIIDSAIIQKLLPKLHGSRKKIEPTLKALWSLCVNDQELNLETTSEFSEEKSMKYPLSAEKIWRMFRIAQDNGFTSFAEA
mgnify:FL=1